jgi:hypothetical protein
MSGKAFEAVTRRLIAMSSRARLGDDYGGFQLLHPDALLNGKGVSVYRRVVCPKSAHRRVT